MRYDKITLSGNAQVRATERGVLPEEIVETVQAGESFPAKQGRIGYRANFQFNAEQNGKWYAIKQVETVGVEEQGTFVVVTLLSKYF